MQNCFERNGFSRSNDRPAGLRLHTMCTQAFAVSALLKHGADVKAVDNSGRGVLHHAVTSSGSDDILKLLLAAGAPLGLEDNQGLTAADRASRLQGGSMTSGGKVVVNSHAHKVRWTNVQIG